MSVIIRPANPADSAAIAQVHVDSWRTTYRGIMPDALLDRQSYDQRQAMWERILTTNQVDTVPSCVCVAMTDDGSIVGFASGGPERSADPTYTGEIYAIYLLREYQGRGLGRTLMQQVCQQLARNGVQTLLIWVLAQNPARFFYEKMGGHLVHTRQELFAEVTHEEFAYGWSDISIILNTGS